MSIQNIDFGTAASNDGEYLYTAFQKIQENFEELYAGGGVSDVASAATCNIGAAATPVVRITGATTVTSFGGVADTRKYVYFSGALTLTHNATSLILPGSINITTVAGDTALFISDASGNWRCFHYQSVRNLEKTVKSYGASGSAQTTTGTISSSSTTLALASALDFKAGQGILIYGAGAAPTVGVPSGTFNGPINTTGSTTYAYKVASLDNQGGISIASSAFSNSFGVATLGTYLSGTSGIAMQEVRWSMGTGSPIATVVWRSKNGGTYELLGAFTGTGIYDTGLPTQTITGIPSTPPASAVKGWLATTIVSGAGTTSLTVADAATTTVSSATVQHDDTTAIDNAMASETAIDFPSGTYNVRGLFIPTTVKSFSSNAGATVKSFALPDEGGTGGVYAYQGDGIAIDGINFETNATMALDALFVYQADNPTIRNCTFNGSRGLLVSECTKPIIASNRALGWWNVGIHSNNNTNASIDNNTIAAISGQIGSLAITATPSGSNYLYGSGIWSGGAGAGCRITSNTVTQYGGSFGISGQSPNMLIANNSVGYAGREAIAAGLYSNYEVTGNFCYWAAAGNGNQSSYDFGLSVGDDGSSTSLNFPITGNTFVNSGFSAVGVYGNGGTLQDVTIDRNYIYGCNQLSIHTSGIEISGSGVSKVYVGTNTFHAPVNMAYNVGEVNNGTGAPDNNVIARQLGSVGSSGAVLRVGSSTVYDGNTLTVFGTTSGTITIKPQAAAGTFNFNLPTAAGTSGYVLTSGGGGTSPMTWTNPTSLPIDLDVGSTAVTGGTSTRILYDNAGVLGEYTTTGTGTVVVMQTSPSFLVSIGTPQVFAFGAGSGTQIWKPATNTSGTIVWPAGSVDFSATGGTGQVVKQTVSGNPFTVGTLAASEIASGAALTKTDDTNVTLTLGGSPTSSLLAATSLTLGWTGTLSASRGGTGISSLGTGIATFLGTPSSANLAAAITDETGSAGSGLLVFSTSPALTGSPTAPTQTVNDNSTKIATTAYADAIAALKANLASPTFTGTPAAPTAAVDTNTTQIATTAMVLAQAASATPLVAKATAVVGTSTRFARGDHVHPGREVVTSNATYYVRSDGSDSNTGTANTAGGAFLTLQKAWDIVSGLDLSTYSATINMGTGTFGPLSIDKMPVGGSGVTINGNGSTNTTVASTTSARAISVTVPVTSLTLSALKITATGGSTGANSDGIYASGPAQIYLGSDINFGAVSGAHMRIINNCHIQPNTGYTISGNFGYNGHVKTESGGVYEGYSIAVTITGSPAWPSAFTWADTGSAQIWYGFSFGTATGTRYSATLNGVINTYGGAAFPGSVGGSTATGGQYA